MYEVQCITHHPSSQLTLYIVRVWCFGSGFSFFVTNLASVHVHVHDTVPNVM